MLRKGFTLIELLIVIAILGILAVAVLSAINPLEQMKKARDSRRKSDAAELLNGYERYFTTFGCWPWEATGAGNACGSGSVTIANPGFVASSNSGELLTKEELKAQFSSRDSVTNNELFVTEASTGQASVCFSPESKSARAGGLGPVRNQQNAAAGSCGAAYASSDATCNICIPQ